MSETNKNVVELSKPYVFEGKEYTEVDLTGLEDLSGQDLIDADQVYGASGQYSPVPELALGYNLVIAAKVTKLPVEFFNQLPAKDTLKVKNTVMGFLNN